MDIAAFPWAITYGYSCFVSSGRSGQWKDAPQTAQSGSKYWQSLNNLLGLAGNTLWKPFQKI
jgi:hypothetical protein